MIGVQHSDKYKATRSDISVVLCTDFSYQINEEKCKALGIEGFVMKSIIMKKIAATIRNMLDN
jgi:DNA-binding NarL/FixJ family response regulator